MSKRMREVKTFADLFENGMGRDPGDLWEEPPGLKVNLGSGASPIPGALNLDLPRWNAERDPIPCRDGEVAVAHAYHFLEHLTREGLFRVLYEVQRALKPAGLFNIVVPYARADIAFQDPTHQLFFTEETWKTIISNEMYSPELQARGTVQLQFVVNFNLIAGVAGRNLCLFTQLRKGSR